MLSKHTCKQCSLADYDTYVVLGECLTLKCMMLILCVTQSDPLRPKDTEI